MKASAIADCQVRAMRTEAVGLVLTLQHVARSRTPLA